MTKKQKILHCFWESCPTYGDVSDFKASLKKYLKIVSENQDWNACPESEGKYYYSVRYYVAVPCKNMIALGKFLSTLPYGLHHYRLL